MLISFKNDLEQSNYQRLKDLANIFSFNDVKQSSESDSIQYREYFHQADIIKIISNLQNEDTFENSVIDLSKMININRYQIITFFSKKDFQYLLNGIRSPATIVASLYLLLNLIRNEDLLSCFFAYIKENDFFFISIIKDILNNSDNQDCQQISICLLGMLSCLDEFRPLLIKYDVLLTVNNLANKDDEMDCYISYFYKFISEYSFDENTQVLFKIIFPIIQNFCKHENHEIVHNSLVTICKLMRHSPLPCEAIVSNSMIGLFVSFIQLSKSPHIQCDSLKILISCIKDPDFPFESILELNLIDVLFSALQSNDEDLAILCVELFDIIFQISEPSFIQEVINICSKYNFLSYFSSQLFETKIKAIDIFDNIIQKLTPENSQNICSDETIDFILNLLLSSDDQFIIVIKVTNVLNILISLFHNNSQFVVSFLSNVKDSGSLDYLTQILDDTKITPECNDSIVAFLNNISMLKKELDIADES